MSDELAGVYLNVLGLRVGLRYEGGGGHGFSGIAAVFSLRFEIEADGIHLAGQNALAEGKLGIVQRFFPDLPHGFTEFGMLGQVIFQVLERARNPPSRQGQ